jgi:hypothetical protein
LEGVPCVVYLAGVYTYHNDVSRTGQNLQEYGLSPSTVSSSTFGVLFSCAVDGYVYAEPLYVANLAIAGGTHNVVFIATEHDSVYAFDADSSACTILWQTSFLKTGVTPVPAADYPTTDLIPEIGITSTPVIDPATSTLYVEAKTKETVGSGCSSSSPCYVHRLHALSLTTGGEKLNGPVAIAAPSLNFSSFSHLQRPALLLSGGTVYIGFGSHGDQCPYQGWLFAYDATTLAQRFVYAATQPGNTSGGSVPCNAGGIWLSGSGPSVDAAGNIYVSTGNGTFDVNTGGTNYSDSVVKVSPTGSVLDYFTPWDQPTMKANDIDLGASGVVILPDAVGSAGHPHLALATGKIGILYLLDQTNLGKFHSTSNSDVQEVTVGLNTTNLDGGIFGSPAYWNGNIYVGEVSGALRQYTIANGSLSLSSLSNSVNTFPLRGVIPVISANGTSGGIVWVLDLTGWQTNQPAILDAYDANLRVWIYGTLTSPA